MGGVREIGERGHTEATGELGHTEVHLEIVLGAPQIAGTVVDGDGERKTFSGWLEFVPLLENLRGAPTEPTSGGV